MPFPFNRLPWGEQYRLRNLMTPSELYQMQLALGGTQNGLGPLQPSRKNNKSCGLIRNQPQKFLPKAEVDDRNAQRISKLAYYVDTEGYNEIEVIIMECLSVEACILETDLEIPRFFHPNAILNIKEVELESRSKVDESAMRKLASLCSKECRSFASYSVNSEMNMPLIFTLFPNLTNLTINVNRTDTWLDDLFKIKMTSLESLKVIIFSSDDEKLMFDHLNVESLHKLCKAQPPNFQLTLYSTGEEVVRSSVWNFLKPYFRKVRNKNDSTSLIIVINSRKIYCACCD